MPTPIDRDELQRLLAEQQAQLVEVLPADEYEDEHLPGASNVPLKELDRQSTSMLDRIGRRVIRIRADVTAEEAMTPAPSTIRPSARLDAIVERMRRQTLTSLPVTTPDGRLVGLISLVDAEHALAAVDKS